MQKYDDAKAALANAGVTLVEAEWPAGDGSSPGVNVLAEALFLQEFNGAALSMNYHVFHTYMGQVSQWVNDYLGVDISIDDIVKDAHPAGQCMYWKGLTSHILRKALACSPPYILI